MREMTGIASDAQAGWDCHVHVFEPGEPSRAGHYRPVSRPLAAIEQLAGAHGIERLVLVQPSIYGTDNSVLLRALQAGTGRHRGVAVVAPDIDDATLDRMHALGVRGIRFNLVSPVGQRDDPLPALRRLAPRLAERGWHVQWYAHARQLPLLAEWQGASAAPFVLDHVASLHGAQTDASPAWQALAALAAQGAWLKLSGWYRLDADAPYDALLPVIGRAAALFGARCVWGSDWPHTSFAPDRLPGYDTMLHPVRAALGDAAAHAVLATNPRDLYLSQETTT